MRKSSRIKEIRPKDSMPLTTNGNRDECHDAVREVGSAVATLSNDEMDVQLNGQVNIRDGIQAPEVDVKVHSMIDLLSPSEASFPSNSSGGNDESAVDHANNASDQVDGNSANSADAEKQGHGMSVNESKPSLELDGTGQEVVKVDGDGAESRDSAVAVHGRDTPQATSTHAMRDDEFRNFLEMGASGNPMNRSGDEVSRSLENGNDLAARQRFLYHPLGGESLLRRALLAGIKEVGHQYNGFKPTGEAMNPHQSTLRVFNGDENLDVDVETVDGGVAMEVLEPINLSVSSNTAGANVDTVSDSRAVRQSTVQKRKLTAQPATTDAKKGFPGTSLEEAEMAFAEMSKQKIRTFIQKESLKPKPDFSKLSEAMDITYESTRKFMYDEGHVDVRDIKKKFPALLHYRMVKEEFGRILKDPTKMERLENELDKQVLSSALEGKKKTLCPGKKRHPIWKKSIQLWDQNKASSDNAQHRKILGMLAVCFEFAENAVVAKMCKVLKHNEKLSDIDVAKMDLPTIVVRESQIFNVFDENDIWIYVDGQKYMKVPNMYEAVLTVFAVYYVFNIAYDKSLKSLFEFFDYLCDNAQTTYPKTN